MNETILVVDDEREIADLLEIYLKNDGYTVHTCATGAEALRCVESEHIDLALLDVMLPDIDGFSLCRKIRESRFFPILMLTARVADNDKILGLTIGADDYITKPFNPLEVVARVKTQLRRAGRYNQSARRAGRRRRIRHSRSHHQPRKPQMRALRSGACAHADRVFDPLVSLLAAGTDRAVRGAVRGRVEGEISAKQQQHRHGAHRPAARKDERAAAEPEIHQDRLGGRV